MLAFADMLVEPARNAGITIPENIDNYEKEKFPHWHVYQLLQLGQALPHPSAHWSNAEVIAALSGDDLMQMTYQDFLEAGFEAGFPLP